MSSRTRGVAVAVSATQEAAGKAARTSASCRYSGRKSWPHWEMQCASSMAMQSTVSSARSARVRGARSASGAR